MRELTLKEQRFLDLYTNPDNKGTFGNGTQSYIQAGYKAKNNAVARNGGSEILAKPYIKERIRELMDKFESNFSRHLQTLDKKLEGLADEGKISKEELQAIRLGLEAEGKLGKGVNIGIAIGDRPCADCPHQTNILKTIEALRILPTHTQTS